MLHLPWYSAHTHSNSDFRLTSKREENKRTHLASHRYTPHGYSIASCIHTIFTTTRTMIQIQHGCINSGLYSTRLLNERLVAPPPSPSLESVTKNQHSPITETHRPLAHDSVSGTAVKRCAPPRLSGDWKARVDSSLGFGLLEPSSSVRCSSQLSSRKPTNTRQVPTKKPIESVPTPII